MDRESIEGSDDGGRTRLSGARWAERLAPAIFVAALAGYSAWKLAPAIGRAWYYRSDEYAVIGEIIRFLHLDFRQHYFDMPETPVMFLAAAAWALL